MIVFDAMGRMAIEQWGFDLAGRPPVANWQQAYARDIGLAVAEFVKRTIDAQYPLPGTPVAEPKHGPATVEQAVPAAGGDSAANPGTPD